MIRRAHLIAAYALLALTACRSASRERAVAERVAQDTVSRTWRHEVGVDSVRLHGDTNVVWISPRNWMATDAPQAGVRVAPTGRVLSIQWILGG
jgi:hypothetical protein